ncbi:MAG: hypothetical protein WEA75_06720 [Acidimicrobiia bacterium]
MTTRITIDPNVRVRGNQTYAGFEDIEGIVPIVGAPVEVYEVESGATGNGIVAAIDDATRLVYVAVEWASLRVSSPWCVNVAAAITAANFTTRSAGGQQIVDLVYGSTASEGDHLRQDSREPATR